jgi:DNA-binding Lrp family transcriptional regulator
MAELRRDPSRSNRAIAAAVGCGERTVRHARSALLADGVIARRSPTGAAPKLRAILPTWRGSASELARRIGCSPAYVSRMMRKLEDEATLRRILEPRDA